MLPCSPASRQAGEPGQLTSNPLALSKGQEPLSSAMARPFTVSFQPSSLSLHVTYVWSRPKPGSQKGSTLMGKESQQLREFRAKRFHVVV